jgi:glucosamine--fructose-6-phosphate aminotransferase (isomerizing)
VITDLPECENSVIDEIADFVIRVDSMTQIGKMICATVILQRLAYHTAKSLKRDVDKPRNLAKSVTVG